MIWPLKHGNNLSNNLSDEHLNRARKEYEYEVENEILERLYNTDEDDYILKPKDKTKDTIKTKTETKAKSKTDSETSVKPLRGLSKTHGDNNIYTRIKYECKECHEEFRNKLVSFLYMNE